MIIRDLSISHSIALKWILLFLCRLRLIILSFVGDLGTVLIAIRIAFHIISNCIKEDIIVLKDSITSLMELI